MKKIISVVGARPNFMKIAPIHFEFSKYKNNITHLICHTGQHYDEKMSKVSEMQINEIFLLYGMARPQSGSARKS
jgi:UDP-N-acetylglucosamine 2-epimerase